MFVSLYSFGNEVEGDVLENVSELTKWESYVLRIIFLLVISTHTPFIFFIGKESVLALFALLFLRSKNESIDTFVDLDTAKSHEVERLISKHQSVDHHQLTRRLDKSRMIAGSSVDYNISMALPFQSQAFDKLDVGDDANQESRMAAHEILPNYLYYPITIILYVAVVGSACVIKDIDIVIGFVGSLGNSMIGLTWPGTFYFIIMTRYQPSGYNRFQVVAALMLAIYGLFMGVFCTAITIWSAIDRE